MDGLLDFFACMRTGTGIVWTFAPSSACREYCCHVLPRPQPRCSHVLHSKAVHACLSCTPCRQDKRLKDMASQLQQENELLRRQNEQLRSGGMPLNLPPGGYGVSGGGGLGVRYSITCFFYSSHVPTALKAALLLARAVHLRDFGLAQHPRCSCLRLLSFRSRCVQSGRPSSRVGHFTNGTGGDDLGLGRPSAPSRRQSLGGRWAGREDGVVGRRWALQGYWLPAGVCATLDGGAGMHGPGDLWLHRYTLQPVLQRLTATCPPPPLPSPTSCAPAHSLS